MASQHPAKLDTPKWLPVGLGTEHTEGCLEGSVLPNRAACLLERSVVSFFGFKFVGWVKLTSA
jgi:hypothetical protein